MYGNHKASHSVIARSLWYLQRCRSLVRARRQSRVNTNKMLSDKLWPNVEEKLSTVQSSFVMLSPLAPEHPTQLHDLTPLLMPLLVKWCSCCRDRRPFRTKREIETTSPLAWTLLARCGVVGMTNYNPIIYGLLLANRLQGHASNQERLRQALIYSTLTVLCFSSPSSSLDCCSREGGVVQRTVLDSVRTRQHCKG